MREIHVSMKTSEKEVSFQMSDVNELEKVLLIQNIFSFMGVQNDLSQMVDDFAKIGKAYATFFKEVKPLEAQSTDELKLHNGNDYVQKEYSKKRLAKEYNKAMSVEEFDSELSKVTTIGTETGRFDSKESNISSEPKTVDLFVEVENKMLHDLAKKIDADIMKEVPEYYITGIKKDGNVEKYKTRLKCDCGEETNRYITKSSKSVFCHKCGREHQVRNATKKFLDRDSFGNFFVAGLMKTDSEK